MEGVRAADVNDAGLVTEENSAAGSGAHQVGPDGQLVRRRRRHRRHRTLGDKIRHSQKVTRIRRVIAILVLGAAIIAGSTYLANTSVPYEPVPTLPTE